MRELLEIKIKLGELGAIGFSNNIHKNFWNDSPFSGWFYLRNVEWTILGEHAFYRERGDVKIGLYLELCYCVNI